jgi:DNA-binding LacI/PurR family transcriptional regulator
MNTKVIRNPAKISSQIIDRFTTEIESGVYMPDVPLPSYASLAQGYGVSKSTIFEAFIVLSRAGYLFTKQGKGAFINEEKIKKTSKRRMQDIAYIALNVFSANDNQFIPQLETLNAMAQQKQINLHIHFIHGMSVLTTENKLLKRQIGENQYQGLIVAAPLNVEDIKWFSSLHIPFVMATSRYDIPVPGVLMDHVHAVRLAVKLFNNCGVKRLAVFTGPMTWKRDRITPYSNEIHDTFESLYRNESVSIDFIACEYSYLDAKKKTLQHFKSDYDGVFFQTDIIAKGALAAINDMGLDISKTVCINYCDLEDYITPINIIKPVAELGRRSFEMLEAIYKEGKIKEELVLLKPKMVGNIKRTNP